MNKVLNIVETDLEAYMDFCDHCDKLEKHLSKVKDPMWNYQFFIDRNEIMFTFDNKPDVEYIRYCAISKLTDEMIENSDEINFTGETTKNIAREIYNEYNKK